MDIKGIPNPEQAHIVKTPLKGASAHAAKGKGKTTAEARYFRAAGEDDDGYDPYSDRPAPREEAEADPWR